jgi:hypothetical protein
MPTPNDYSRVNFGGSDSAGRQDGPAMEYGQVQPSSTLPAPASGNYPDIESSNLTPSANYQEASGNYPDVFSRVDLGGDNTSDYKARSSQGQTGNFGQAVGPNGPKASTNQVPNSVPSKQFSSDTNGRPEALLATTQASIAAHADLNLAYGLTQPVATVGSHPWLRDSCADPTTSEPASAAPDRVRGVPMVRTAPNK